MVKLTVSAPVAATYGAYGAYGAPGAPAGMASVVLGAFWPANKLMKVTRVRAAGGVIRIDIRGVDGPSANNNRATTVDLTMSHKITEMMAVEDRTTCNLRVNIAGIDSGLAVEIITEVRYSWDDDILQTESRDVLQPLSLARAALPPRINPALSNLARARVA